MNCYICGKKISYRKQRLHTYKYGQVQGVCTARKHHVIPTKLGGGNESDNIVYLCNPCHGEIHGIYHFKALSKVFTLDNLFFQTCLRSLHDEKE